MISLDDIGSIQIGSCWVWPGFESDGIGSGGVGLVRIGCVGLDRTFMEIRLGWIGSDRTRSHGIGLGRIGW